MSHFSTIKTKIKNKPELIEALQLLQYDASATADQSVKDDLIEKSKSILNDLDAIGYGKKI